VLLEWWQAFNDPRLIELLQAAETDNPSLDQAAAAIASARASRTQAAASAYPAVNASASSTRTGSLKSGVDATSTVSSGLLDASWEIDLFGSIRRSREAASARVQASEASWHNARVSLAAEVASEYVRYRACRLLADNQQQNLASLNKTASATAAAVQAGLTPAADANLVQASVAGASASLNVQQAECDVGIKSLVALTGLDETVLRAKLAGEAQNIPNPEIFDVTSLPVQIVSQRPDLVAAERSLAAASADIGVAEANRYPRLSLLGAITLEHNQVSGASVQGSLWSFGPSLTLPVFNGGALRAQVARAQADYEASLASYRAAVRNAVKEVEQSLVRLDAATRRSTDLNNSARDYRRYYEATRQNWQVGGTSLLNLELASRNALQAEQSAIAVQRDRVLYGIALYKALGGGWQTAQTLNRNGAAP
jgi:NodT family efflux transporter outer membrane factor (OMF) lipoprotein